MRHSTGLGLFTLILGLLVLLAVLDSRRQVSAYNGMIKKRIVLQKVIGLTDLSITTAARYLRHYSLADLTTPYQDYPASMDHFPAGFSFAAPDYKGMPSPVVLKRLKNNE